MPELSNSDLERAERAAEVLATYTPTEILEASKTIERDRAERERDEPELELEL